jgi:hypothetical protein
MIADLSHGIRLKGTRHPSVNEATNPSVAPFDSMTELGNVLPRLIYAMKIPPKRVRVCSMLRQVI